MPLLRLLPPPSASSPPLHPPIIPRACPPPPPQSRSGAHCCSAATHGGSSAAQKRFPSQPKSCSLPRCGGSGATPSAPPSPQKVGSQLLSELFCRYSSRRLLSRQSAAGTAPVSLLRERSRVYRAGRLEKAAAGMVPSSAFCDSHLCREACQTRHSNSEEGRRLQPEAPCAQVLQRAGQRIRQRPAERVLVQSSAAGAALRPLHAGSAQAAWGTHMASRDGSQPSDGGMLPCSWLALSIKTRRLSADPSDGGMLPVSWLAVKTRSVNELRLPSATGMVPFIALLYMESVWRCDRRPRSSGMGPSSAWRSSMLRGRNENNVNNV